ncbi:hypothetical protein C8R44DRAFT_732088 [Mycena epipterygia]|nr:hypothetical protein C8R44DRAFT_732088 [Mycena epipterygia]
MTRRNLPRGQGVRAHQAWDSKRGRQHAGRGDSVSRQGLQEHAGSASRRMGGRSGAGPPLGSKRASHHAARRAGDSARRARVCWYCGRWVPSERRAVRRAGGSDRAKGRGESAQLAHGTQCVVSKRVQKAHQRRRRGSIRSTCGGLRRTGVRGTEGRGMTGSMLWLVAGARRAGRDDKSGRYRTALSWREGRPMGNNSMGGPAPEGGIQHEQLYPSLTGKIPDGKGFNRDSQTSKKAQETGVRANPKSKNCPPKNPGNRATAARAWLGPFVESATSGGVSAPSTLPPSNFGDGYATVHSDTELKINLALVPMPPWMSISHTPSFRAVPHANMPEQFQIHHPTTLRKVREDYGPMEDRLRLPQCHPNNFANPAWFESVKVNYLSKYGTSNSSPIFARCPFKSWRLNIAGLPNYPYDAYYVPSNLPHPILQSYEPLDTFVPEAPVNCYDGDEANALFQRNQANMAKWLEQDSQRQKDHVDAFATKSRVWQAKVDNNRERIKSLCAAQTQNWLDLENDRTWVLHRIRQETNSVGEMIYFKLTREHPPVPTPLSSDVRPSDPSSHTAPLKCKRTSTTEPPADDAPGDDIVMGGGEFPPISHINEDPDSEDDKPILLKLVVPLVVQGTRTQGRPAKGKAPDVPAESTSNNAGVSMMDGAPAGDWHLRNLPSAFRTFPVGSATAQGRGYPVTINGKYILVRGLEEFGILSESLPLLVFFTRGKLAGVRRVPQGWPPVHRDPEGWRDAGQIVPPLSQVEVESLHGIPAVAKLGDNGRVSRTNLRLIDRALGRINVMWIDLLVRAIINIFTELLGVNINEHILHSCLVRRHSPEYAADSLDTTAPFPVVPSSAPSAFASTSTPAATQPATFAPSDIAVAQLTSLLSSPDQPIFKSLLDGLPARHADLASNPRNDGSADEVPPRNIPRASVESGDGSSKAEGKGKAKADLPPRVELPAPGPDTPTTPQPRARQHTTSPLVSSGSLCFGPSPHIGGTSSSSIAGIAASAWVSQPPRGSPSKPYSRAESVTSRHSSQTNIEDLVEQDGESSDTLAVTQSLSSPRPSFRSQLWTTDEDHDALEYGTEEDLQGDTLAAVEASGMDTSEG